MAKRQVSVSMEDELLTYVDQIAGRMRRSRSDMITMILLQFKGEITLLGSLSDSPTMKDDPHNDFGIYGPEGLG